MGSEMCIRDSSSVPRPLFAAIQWPGRQHPARSHGRQALERRTGASPLNPMSPPPGRRPTRRMRTGRSPAGRARLVQQRSVARPGQSPRGPRPTHCRRAAFASRPRTASGLARPLPAALFGSSRAPCAQGARRTLWPRKLRWQLEGPQPGRQNWRYASRPHLPQQAVILPAGEVRHVVVCAPRGDRTRSRRAAARAVAPVGTRSMRTRSPSSPTSNQN